MHDHDHIDIYCERLEPGLWAEPINAFTNISFIIATVLCYILARRADRLDWKSALLILFLCCIGIGSTLFHTFANKVTLILDVAPILLYQITFILLYCTSVIKLSPIKTGALFLLFFISSLLCEQIPTHVMNGSLSYAPSILYIAGFAIWHYKNSNTERYTLALAAVIFTLSLTFRSIDMAICNSMIIGSHFLWHLLNGCVLYLTTRAFILREKKD